MNKNCRIKWNSFKFFLAAAVVSVMLIASLPGAALASPASTIYFSPASTTTTVGSSFNLAAMINPGTNAVSALSLHITFDPSKMSLTSITPSSAFSTVLAGHTIDNTGGTASEDLAVPLGTSSVTTTSTVATFAFQALATGTNSAVSFTTATIAAADGESGNVIITRTGGTVTVNGGTGGPTLSEVTPVTTPTKNTAPSYVFSSTEAGTITYGGACSSATTDATSGHNTVTLTDSSGDAFADGTYSDCTITVTDADSNASNPLPMTAFTIDTTAPTVTEVTPVTTPTNDTTPNYTFNTTEAGTITYGGDCSSSTTNAVSGHNTVTFNTLSSGTHSNCTIKVTDAAGNASSVLDVTSFTIDTTAPTLAEVTPVPTPTADTTPDYTFSSSKAGTIAYGGSCSSATTSATSGNNTITLTKSGGGGFTDGTYSNCTITVTDGLGNHSSALSVSSFTINTSAPTISGGAPSGVQASGTTTATLQVTTNESATCRYSTTPDTAYSSMTHTFSTTGGTSHSTDVTVSDDNFYDYYVRCQNVAGNADADDYEIQFSVAAAGDNTAPTVTEVTPVTTPTSDTTPNYTFNTTEAGAITYGGDCFSDTDSAVSGDNTITFDTLSAGTYSNCTITVTDASGNASGALAVSSFVVTSGSSNSSGSSSSHHSDDVTIDLNISHVKYLIVSPTQIDVTWRTNNNANETVRYGTNKNLTQKKSDHSKNHHHMIHLENLAAGKIYYFRAYSEDGNGQSARTKIYSLTTSQAVPVKVTVAPVVRTEPAASTPVKSVPPVSSSGSVGSTGSASGSNANTNNANSYSGSSDNTPGNADNYGQNGASQNSSGSGSASSGNSSASALPQPNSTPAPPKSNFVWWNPFTWF